MQQSRDYLFNTDEYINYPNLSASTAGKLDDSIDGIALFSADQLATDSTRNGIIKNFRANKYYTENNNTMKFMLVMISERYFAF